MQQTSKYQFNLVDATDDFSPTPLNQNAQKMEDALEALDASVAESLEDMEDTVATLAANVGTAGKNARIQWGSYAGNNGYGMQSRNTLTFPFCPVLVVVACQDYTNGASSPGVLLRPMTEGHSEIEHMSSSLNLTWTETGVQWYSSVNAQHQMNQNKTYYYVAVGYDAAAEA